MGRWKGKEGGMKYGGEIKSGTFLMTLPNVPLAHLFPVLGTILSKSNHMRLEIQSMDPSSIWNVWFISDTHVTITRWKH